MDVVRSLTDSWPDLTSVFIAGRDPACLTARKILDVLCECEDEMDINEVLLSVYVCNRFMYVADRKKLWIHDMWNCRIVGWFILQQNMLVCRNFIFWLDRL